MRGAAVRSLAQAPPRWQQQSQDEDPGLGFLGWTLPKGGAGVPSWAFPNHCSFPQGFPGPQTHHCCVSHPPILEFPSRSHSPAIGSREAETVSSCCTLGARTVPGTAQCSAGAERPGGFPISLSWASRVCPLPAGEGAGLPLGLAENLDGTE